MTALPSLFPAAAEATLADMGKVSFIVPNYNHARYLGQAIRSALAQTYQNIEIIVVDDGSTDESRSVVEPFVAESGERVRYIYQQNAGLSAARNTGVQAACGEYIALLDADDMLEPTYAERLLAALAQCPGADGAYCGFRFVDEDSRSLPRTERRTVAPELLFASLLNGNYWVPVSLLARRACYTALGEFDTSLRACEDWDVWLRFARCYRLIGVDEVLVRYRVVSGSMSTNPTRMIENRLAVLRKHLGDRPNSFGRTTVHQAYARAYLRSAVEYLRVGHDESAYRSLINVVELAPHFLMDRATYYELACSRQARGTEGQSYHLDVTGMETFLEQTINRLGADSELQPALRSILATQRSQTAAQRTAPIEAQAQWALGMLSYQAGLSTSARKTVLKAFRLQPGLLCRRTFAGLMARVLVGRRQVALLKRSVRRTSIKK
jgi:tetratricopeptide (TPR) repeat protein